jgi:RimJ/RimL family protein N-acetyltransferase
MASAPEEIDLGWLLLRRFRETDAKPLNEAIEESLDELRPWMPWAATEPLSVEERLGLIRRWRFRWEDHLEFDYAIVERDDRLVGACALVILDSMRRLALGYWVRTSQTSRGIATLAARGLTDAAFAMGEVEEVEIHHDRANLTSARIPAKLGYRFVGEVEHSIDAPGQTGTSVIWRTATADWIWARAEGAVP